MTSQISSTVHVTVPARRSGHPVPLAVITQIAEQQRLVLEERLRAVAGMGEFLRDLKSPRRIASSSSIAWTRRALVKCGLTEYFEDDALFSAQFVERGKPAPDLFLMRHGTWDTRPTRVSSSKTACPVSKEQGTQE